MKLELTYIRQIQETIVKDVDVKADTLREALNEAYSNLFHLQMKNDGYSLYKVRITGK